MAEHGSAWQPDDETLAAYIEGRLSAEERARVEAVVAADPERYEWLVSTFRAVELAAEDGVAPVERPLGKVPQNVVRFPTRLWAGVGIGLAAAAALVLALVWPRQPAAGIPTLVAAAGEQRFVEGRLVGGFKFGPLRSGTRGPEDDVDPRRVALLSAAATLRERADRTPSAESLHDYGVARLLLGPPDEAIRLLTEAVEREDRPAFRSNLATAYAARARVNADAGDWARALDESAKALARDAALVEALYTNALATEALHLPKAVEAWEAYLRVDASGPWADDARRRLAALKARPITSSRVDNEKALWAAIRAGDAARLREAVARDPQRTRELIEEDLPGAWAAAIAGGDEAGAAAALGQASNLVAAYATVSDDKLPALGIERLRTAAPADRSPLAAASTAYIEAVHLVREDRQPEADARFAAAAPAFERFGSPLRLWVRYYAAAGAARRGELEAALATLAQIQREADSAGFSLLSGTTRGRSAQVLGRRGDHEAAIRERLASEAFFRRAGDVDQIALLHAFVSEAATLAGDATLAWTHHLKSLELLERAPNPRSRHLVLVEAGLTCAWQGLHHAALPFHAAVVDNGRAWGRASAIASGLFQEARNLVAIGRREQGVEQIEAARVELGRIPDAGFRERIELDWLEVHAEAMRGAQPAEALDSIDRALERFQRTGYSVRLAELWLMRGEVAAGTGDFTRAESDWRRAASLLEGERKGLSKAGLRLAQAGGLRRVNTTLALERYRQRLPPAESLAPVEAARSRTLVEEALSGAAVAADIGALQRRLPEGVALYYVVVGRGDAVGWFVDRQRVLARPLAASVDALGLALRRYRRLAAGADAGDGFRAASRELHAALFGPFATELAGVRELIVVPDPALTGVSFATLVDPRTNRYLIESHVVGVAPSGALALRERPPMSAVSAVVVGADETPNMPRLPWARVEAERVAEQYSQRTVLVGRNATRDALLGGLGPGRVVHFAGHAAANPAAPLLSRLLLYPTATAPPELYAHDLERTDLTGDVVVLAACRSGYAESDATDDDAVLAMARPFLARGARSVIASYWDVGDAPSVDLMADFHRRLVQGTEAPAAWQGAVLAAIGRQVPVSTWGGYGVFVGGRS